MSRLLKQFFYICLLNKGPQDLPGSYVLLYITLLAYLISGILSMLTTMSLELAFPVMLVDLSVLLLYPWLCLKAFRKSERFIQMVTALAGVGTIFQIAAWPLMTYIDGQQATLPPAVSMMLLIVVAWNLVVYAHIFRESFNIRLLSAYVLALMFAVISASARHLFFPDLGV
jgi:hypothetical protein